jgi:T4 bacteriophage base plate protein
MMSKKPLPIVSSPTLVTTLPLSKLKVSYRPFVVKEQKALLLAQESKDSEAVVETMKSVIESCTNGTLDFTKAPTADIAYFFLQLRIASVGPQVKFNIPCTSCGEPNTINMSLEDVKVSDWDPKSANVKLTDQIGIVFKLPTIADALATGPKLGSIQILYNLIDYIYDQDQMWNREDYTEEEFGEWLEGLNEKQVESIKQFTMGIPELAHTLDYNCTHCGEKQSRRLEGLQSFFRLGISS